MKKVVIVLLILIWLQPCMATYFIEGRNYGDTLSIDEPNHLGFGYGDFSLCVWIRTTAGIGVNAYIAEFLSNGGYDGYLEIDLSASIAKPRCKLADESMTDEASVYSTVAINDGLWHLITVICDRDVYHGNRMWIDGSDVSYWAGDIRHLTSVNFDFEGSYKYAYLPKISNSPTYLQLDQFRFYKNKILTQPEIAAIYNGGVGTPVIESEMESLSGFYYFEFEEGSGNPVGRYWNGSSWANSYTVNTGLLWGFGGVDPWNQYERNGDCWINFIDYSIFAEDWGKTEPNLISDFDFSGTVDINDLAMFVDYWLTGSQGAAPVVQDESFSLVKNTEHTFDIDATDIEELVYSIESLPSKGTVWDANGSQVTSVPRVLSSKTVRYVAGDYNDVYDSFTFAADDYTGYDPPCGGKVTATATIFIDSGLPGKATNPIPDNNATLVEINTNLSWTPGEDANSHLIYFGTDVNSPEYQTEQDSNLFDPNDLLAYSTVYWWRIDESGPNGIRTGDLWKFTTKPPQAAPVAFDVNVSVYTFVTSIITLEAADDGDPNPPGRLEYIITSLPSDAVLQDPCSGAGIIDGNMLPYTLSGYGDSVWFATESNSTPRTFQYQAYDSNSYSNTATVTVVVLDHPRDLLSFDGGGVVEFVGECYNVTGTLSPDATGIYCRNGSYNGYPKYARTDGDYEIWDTGSGIQKVISNMAGSPDPSWLQNNSVDYAGEYLAWIAATGTAVVAEEANPYDMVDGWAIDFWVRTREPFTGLLNKRDVNQGWEIGITSGKPKLYLYDSNGAVVADVRGFWRIDDGQWHEVSFNYNNFDDITYLKVETDMDYGWWGEVNYPGIYSSFNNDCNLQLGFNSKQGYRGDIDMLRFFADVNQFNNFAFIQGFLNRDGSGFESFAGIGIDSIIRWPLDEGEGLTVTDDKLGYIGTLQDPNHVRWYPFYWPFEDVSVQQSYRRNP